MAKHVKCEGIDEFKAEAQKHKGKTVFVLFSGSTDKDGKSWCPDCETAHPVIERNLQHIPEDAVYIYCSVGDRDYWKDPANAFRTDEDLKLKSVPTLLCLGKKQRLEEGQCAKDDLVEMMFTED